MTGIVEQNTFPVGIPTTVGIAVLRVFPLFFGYKSGVRVFMCLGECPSDWDGPSRENTYAAGILSH